MSEVREVFMELDNVRTILGIDVEEIGKQCNRVWDLEDVVCLTVELVTKRCEGTHTRE